MKIESVTNKGIKFEFSARMWRHAASGGWYFVSVPKNISQKIREHLSWQEEGWGRMKSKAQIKDVFWSTAIWFDTKKRTYLLPVKAEIRKKCKLEVDKEYPVIIWI